MSNDAGLRVVRAAMTDDPAHADMHRSIERAYLAWTKWVHRPKEQTTLPLTEAPRG